MPLFPSSTKGRFLAAGVVGALGLSLTGAGVYSALSAQAYNTTAETVTSGTLSLVMGAGSGSAGFGQPISAMAPGDTVNRYVDLTNNGDLEGNVLTLKAADTVGSRLSTDSTNGLQVTVTSCSVAWSGSSCTGTATPLASSSVAALTTTPATLVGGAVPVGVQHLQVSLTLPDSTETTVNGVLPSASIQKLSADLTWTFTMGQRAGSTTNS